jgi:hypothetical protein
MLLRSAVVGQQAIALKTSSETKYRGLSAARSAVPTGHH